MRANVRSENALNFLLFSNVHRAIMKNVDGRYIASVKLKINGKEKHKDWVINVINGEMNFDECMTTKGIQSYEIISVERVKDVK